MSGTVDIKGPSTGGPLIGAPALNAAINPALAVKADAAPAQATATGLAAVQNVATSSQQTIATLTNSLATANAAIIALQTLMTTTRNRVTVLETATPPPAVPNAVATFALGATTNTTQVLNWTAPASGPAVTSYDTQVAPVVAGVTGAFVAGPSVAAGVLTATVTGLTQGTTYDYHVIPRNAAGPGGVSAVLRQTTTTTFTPSPAFTSIPDNATSIIADDGGVWTIVGGVVQLNGTPPTPGSSSSVIRLVKADTGRIFQESNAPALAGLPGQVGWFYYDVTQNPVWVFSSDPRPAAPGSPIKSRILTWLKTLPTVHLISGQMTHSNFAEYDAMVSSLGVTPGLVVCDPWMDAGTNFDASFVNRCIQHWDAGGLVGMSAFIPNPATGGSAQSLGADASVLTVGSAQHNALLGSLDQLAVPLLQYKQHGMAVPFRVLWELDGTWFWWSSAAFTGAQQVQLYQIIHDYLVVTKQCDHLIWTFSTNGSGNYTFPGESLVDIAGWDAYTDNPDGQVYRDAYNRFRSEAPNSLIAEAEFGSGGPGNGQMDPNFDARILIAMAKPGGSMRNLVYIMLWTGWEWRFLANAAAALADAYVLNLSNLGRVS